VHAVREHENRIRLTNKKLLIDSFLNRFIFSHTTATTFAWKGESSKEEEGRRREIV